MTLPVAPNPNPNTITPNLRDRARDLARLPIGLNLRAISLAEGLRAALSVAVIIALNERLHWAALNEAALAALWTCLCDPGGPIRRRLPLLLGFAALGASVTAGVGLARGLGLPVALPLGAFGLFALSFVRVYDQAVQQLGLLLAFALILALDRPLPDLATAGALAAGFIGGALWATLLTLVIWRVHPFLPARRAVAEVYRRLAALAADLQAVLSAGDRDAARWEAHAREHRRAVREAIETARGVVLDTMRTRGATSLRGGPSLIRLEAADQIFGALIALSEVAEPGSALEQRTALHLVRRLRPLLLVLARAAVTADAAPSQRIGRSIDAMAEEAAALPATDRLRPIALRIVERLRIAHTLALPENFLPGADPAGRRASLVQRLLEPVRANLAWRSPALRHALRSTVMATPALAFTMLWFNPFDHWLTITIVAHDAALFRADLCARAGAHRRHRAGRAGGGARRAGVHHAAGDRGGDVPAGDDGAGGARGEPRAVHGRAHAADRAAGGDRSARHQRVVDRGGALRLHDARRGCCGGGRICAVADVGTGAPGPGGARRDRGARCLCRGDAGVSRGRRSGRGGGAGAPRGRAGDQQPGGVDQPGADRAGCRGARRGWRRRW